MDEAKTEEEIKKEMKSNRLLLRSLNAAIQTFWDNYVNSVAPLLKRQAVIDSELEQLQLEERVRTRIYKG